MLLTVEQMKSLKRKSVSVDTEKSKARVKEDFSAASASQKRAIVEASGQTKGSFYRVYDKGTPNARLVLAMSSELDVSPFYYSGEADEKSPCSDDLIKQFLQAHGYKKIVDELSADTKNKPKRTYNRKPKVEAVSADVSEEIVQDAIAPTESEIEEVAEIVTRTTDEATPIPSSVPIVDNLGEVEAVTLLRALFIRAKVGGGAAAYLDEVKKILLA